MALTDLDYKLDNCLSTGDGSRVGSDPAALATETDLDRDSGFAQNRVDQNQNQPSTDGIEND